MSALIEAVCSVFIQDGVEEVLVVFVVVLVEVGVVAAPVPVVDDPATAEMMPKEGAGAGAVAGCAPGTGGAA
jgi:hypothetical protein